MESALHSPRFLNVQKPRQTRVRFPESDNQGAELLLMVPHGGKAHCGLGYGL